MHDAIPSAPLDKRLTAERNKRLRERAKAKAFDAAKLSLAQPRVLAPIVVYSDQIDFSFVPASPSTLALSRMLQATLVDHPEPVCDVVTGKELKVMHGGRLKGLSELFTRERLVPNQFLLLAEALSTSLCFGSAGSVQISLRDAALLTTVSSFWELADSPEVNQSLGGAGGASTGQA